MAAGHVGFKVRASADGSEYISVTFDHASGEFAIGGPTLDMTLTSAEALKADVYGRLVSGRLPFKHRLDRHPDRPLRLRVFVDRSIIEAYFDGCAITACAYSSPDALGVEVIGADDCQRVDAWEMGSMWSDGI